MTNCIAMRAIRVGEVPSSNLGAPIVFKNREYPRMRAKSRENAEARGAVFVAFRGCSEDSGTQRDRRERLAVHLRSFLTRGRSTE
jgi:hypothetical protein